MDGIPTDIRKIATDIVTDLCVKRGQYVGFHLTENEYTENKIACAILAERERCAEIASSIAVDVRNGSERFTAGKIAAQILASLNTEGE